MRFDYSIPDTVRSIFNEPTQVSPRRSRPVVVVTGGASGAGRACALALAKAGADLVLCDNDTLGLQDVARLTGGFARFCDIASETSVEIFARDVIETFPKPRILVNAAGSDYVRALGMMRASRSLLPALRKAEGRKMIVNVAPGARLGPNRLFPNAASYDSFLRLSEAIALQTRGSSVETATIVPKRTRDFPSHDSLVPGSIGRVIEIDRLNPDAIAELVLDLARRAINPAADRAA